MTATRTPDLSRRRFLATSAAAGLTGLAAPALASETGPGRAILSRTGLSGATAFALADAETGLILDAYAPHRALPPASVAKILTALYALDRLGPGFAFETRLTATGPIVDGTLQGDLVLEGGGDPAFDTDTLGDMIAALSASGLRKVSGRFLVAHGALPSLARIEPGQPEHAAYNPAVSGAGLNFNRVHLTWEPGASGPKLAFAAPGARHATDVTGFRAEVAGKAPAHRWQDGTEVWSLPAHSLAGRGGVWLPVRAPARYAGRVAQALAGTAGIDLPEPELVALAPPGRVLAARASEPLQPMMRGMLKYSTNLTAEAAGLRASAADGWPRSTLGVSGQEMAGWAARRYGIRDAAFANHSGLSTRSTVSAADLVRVLSEETGRLPELLRAHPIGGTNPTPPRGITAVAKTGTMYFVSALAGYLEGPRQRRLAFAILSADLEARERLAPDARGRPPGARNWAIAARGQQHALLRRWSARLGDGGPLRPRARPRPADAVSGSGPARL